MLRSIRLSLTPHPSRNRNATLYPAEEYAPNEKGFNIVVYDPKADMILTSRSFEITEK